MEKKLFMTTINLFSADEMVAVEEIKQVFERIISLSLRTKSKRFSLIQVYAPQCGRPTRKREDFYQLLENTVDSVKYKTD